MHWEQKTPIEERGHFFKAHSFAAGNLLLTCMILISWQTNPLTRAGPSRGIGTVFSSQILLGVAPAQGRFLESPPTDQSLPGIVGSKTGQ
jgi:hypothetical protein